MCEFEWAYDVFVLLGVVCDFRDCDAAGDVVATGSFACGNRKSACISYRFVVISNAQ